jgi:hypothetical protein
MLAYPPNRHCGESQRIWIAIIRDVLSSGLGTSRECLQLKIKHTLERLPDNVCTGCQCAFHSWKMDQGIAPLVISECYGQWDSSALSRLVCPGNVRLAITYAT